MPYPSGNSSRSSNGEKTRGVNPLAQRVEVKRFQRALRPDLVAVVRNKQFAVHEENVRFDRAEAALQRRRQRPRVLVIVVGEGVDQHDRLRGAARYARARDRDKQTRCK